MRGHGSSPAELGRLVEKPAEYTRPEDLCGKTRRTSGRVY